MLKASRQYIDNWTCLVWHVLNINQTQPLHCCKRNNFCYWLNMDIIFMQHLLIYSFIYSPSTSKTTPIKSVSNKTSFRQFISFLLSYILPFLVDHISKHVSWYSLLHLLQHILTVYPFAMTWLITLEWNFHSREDVDLYIHAPIRLHAVVRN